jgi:hypothetical protein
MLRSGILVGAGLLVGCAGRGYELDPGRTLLVHSELPTAKRAVEAARQAGKDRQCPDAFREAEQAKDEAYQLYWACNTAGAIAKANEATAKAGALCPRPAAVPSVPAHVQLVDGTFFRADLLDPEVTLQTRQGPYETSPPTVWRLLLNDSRGGDSIELRNGNRVTGRLDRPRYTFRLPDGQTHVVSRDRIAIIALGATPTARTASTPFQHPGRLAAITPLPGGCGS